MTNQIKYPVAYLTAGTVIALALGFVFGLLNADGEASALRLLVVGMKPGVDLWLSSLRYLAIVLASTFLVSAIAAARDRERVGRLAASAALQHFAFLTIACAVSFAAVPLLSFFPKIDASVVLESIDVAGQDGPGEAASLMDRLVQMFQNPISAILEANILAIIVWSIVFGFVVSILPQNMRRPVGTVCARASQWTQWIIGKFLLLMPLGVFYVVYLLVDKVGLTLAGSIGFFIVVLCGILSSMIVFLYGVVWLVAGVRPRTFGKALAPVYSVAIGSRSSLISLPALIETARNRLKLPPVIHEFVLPLVNTTMKGSKITGHPFALFFLSGLFGVKLDLVVVAIFVLGLYQISFISSGLPSGGSNFSLPVYLAAGIPIEAYLFLKAIDILPDMFKTTLNVTEDLAIAVVTSHLMSEPVPEPVPIPVKS